MAAAVFFLSLAPMWARNILNSTRANRNATPMNVCHPTKYHKRHAETIRSKKSADQRRINSFGACSILCTSFEIRLTTWPVVKSLKGCWPRRRIYGDSVKIEKEWEKQSSTMELSVGLSSTVIILETDNTSKAKFSASLSTRVRRTWPRCIMGRIMTHNVHRDRLIHRQFYDFRAVGLKWYE